MHAYRPGLAVRLGCGFLGLASEIDRRCNVFPGGESPSDLDGRYRWRMLGWTVHDGPVERSASGGL